MFYNIIMYLYKEIKQNYKVTGKKNLVETDTLVRDRHGYKVINVLQLGIVSQQPSGL